MSVTTLGLSTMPIPEKIQFARRVAEALSTNPNFPSPSPAIGSLENKTASLELGYNDAQAARQTAKMKTSVQDDGSAELDSVLTLLALYVENASGGDKAKIESAGFNVKNPPAPIGTLPAPVDVQVAPSEHLGTADVAWKPVRGARAYAIERATDAPELEWGVIGTSTRKEASLNSMQSGRKYWFRVAAIGAAGQSAYSDPVPLFAP